MPQPGDPADGPAAHPAGGAPEGPAQGALGCPAEGALDGRAAGPSLIDVVGVDAGGPGPAALEAVAAADLVVAGRRLLESLATLPRRHLVISGGLDEVLGAISAERGRVCVLASGDPGFFGILRPLAARFGPGLLRVRPALSSVAAAFAAVAVPWDDATVVSAHGRPLRDAAHVAARAVKAAVLVGPDSPPEALGPALRDAGAAHPRVVVCSQLGTPGQVVVETDLAGLSARRWDPLSVVLLLPADPVATAPGLAWGLPDDTFEHRDGMLTRSEVRAVALGKLDLPSAGVLWDVGAGSASVAIECALLRPALEVFALERDPAAAEQARTNCARHGVAVRVVEGTAPEALAGLPAPDRVFVGGGGLGVLEASVARLREGGRAVATYAALGRALAAADLLGDLVQLSAARGVRLPDGSLRLAAANPVFVVWGQPDGR